MTYQLTRDRNASTQGLLISQQGILCRRCQEPAPALARAGITPWQCTCGNAAIRLRNAP